MSNLTEQLIKLRDRIAPIAGNFGIPVIKTLVVRKRSELGADEFITITPNPVIREIKLNVETLGIDSVKGAVKTWEVKGISRIYTRNQLQYEAVNYLIGGRQGVTCELVDIKENTLTWDLTLAEKIGEAALY